METNKINADEFVEKFMEGGLQHLTYIQTPIKIFDLRDIAPYLRTPIPPIFLGYNLLIYLTEGYFNHQIESNTFTVEAPAVLICNYGQMSAIPHVDKSAQGYCVLINEYAMSSFLREKEILNIFTIAPLLNLKKDDSADLTFLLRLLYKEIHAHTPYKEYYESLFKTIILKIIQLSDADKTIGRRQEVAIAFRQLVNTHFTQHKTVAYYADKLAVSDNYLNRCVSSVFKKSAKQLILEVAIVHSQLLLLETNKTVASIAYELEFNDPSYFTRLFKKIIGVSPAQYRENRIG